MIWLDKVNFNGLLRTMTRRLEPKCLNQSSPQWKPRTVQQMNHNRLMDVRIRLSISLFR